MERLVERARNAYLQWRSSPSTNVARVFGLPQSFIGVHPSLCQYVDQLSSPEISEQSQVHQSTDSSSGSAYLPNLYHFNSNGIGVTERYAVAPERPTPFMPSSSRVDGQASFNFDYGEITAELEETSFMAWF